MPLSLACHACRTASADDWLTCRRLRNRLVYEYVKDSQLLADALNSAHAAVPLLLATADTVAGEVDRRLAN